MYLYLFRQNYVLSRESSTYFQIYFQFLQHSVFLCIDISTYRICLGIFCAIAVIRVNIITLFVWHPKLGFFFTSLYAYTFKFSSSMSKYSVNCSACIQYTYRKTWIQQISFSSSVYGYINTIQLCFSANVGILHFSKIREIGFLVIISL